MEEALTAMPGHGSLLCRMTHKFNLAVVATLAVASSLAKDVVRVSEFGFDAEDSTRFMQAAIDSGAKKVVVDARRWIVLPLRGRSNQEIFFEDGAVVEAKKGGYLGKDDCVFSFPACSNVVIGGKGTIRMHHDDYLKPPYRKSEWRHAITILGTHNAIVRGLKILNAGGDGIYVGALKKRRGKAFGITDGVRASTGIRIEDVCVDTSVRQGISVTSVDGLIVERCTFKNTRGLPPQSGIDFEPNSPEDLMRGIVMRECVFENNKNHGIELALGRLVPGKSQPFDMVFERCRTIGNATAVTVHNTRDDRSEIGGRLIFRDCSFEHPRNNVFSIKASPRCPFTCEFTGCRIVERNKRGRVVETKVEDEWVVRNLPFLSAKNKVPTVKPAPNFSRARVSDSRPGEMVKLSPIRFRHQLRFVFYADRARTIKFKWRQNPIGRYSRAVFGEVEFSDVDGKIIASAPLPGKDVETLEFDAPKAGFYFLDSRRIGLQLSLLECDAPIAADLTSDWCAAIGSQGELYFSVPEYAPEFGFFVSGDGSEAIGVELVSSTGRSVYNCPSVFARKGHVEQAGADAGLWKVVFRKAEKGRLEDWMFDITGIVGHVFLSPEKFWSFDYPMSSHPAVEWAHEEFTNFATKVFGSAPPVRFRLPSKDGQFAADWKRLEGTDGYAVRWRDGVLNFVAANPKGLVNGVHKWLERHTDIIWPRPGGDLCLYTKRPAPAGWKGLQDEYVDIPAFLRRTLGSNSKSPEIWRFRVRNGDTSLHDRGTRLEHRDLAMRYGMIGCHMDYWGGGRGHNMQKVWFPKTECPDHPEYRMMIDGKRWTGGKMNFCESNPGFVKAFCDAVERKMPSVPRDIKLINITIEDRVLTCQCDECQKPIRLDDGTFLEAGDPAYRSTRFFRFYNQVARRVAAVRPGAKAIVHGYYHLTEAPRIKLEKNIIVRFCPYPRNMRESFVEGSTNRRWREKLDGWLASGAEIGLREYYWCGNLFFPRPMADTAAVDLRYFLEKGGKYVYAPVVDFDDGKLLSANAKGVMRPSSEFYDMNAMEAWVVERLFWDPSLDPVALRRDFLSRTLGPAAHDVGRFYDEVRRSWYSNSISSSFCDNPFRMASIYIVQNGIADKCRDALKAALAKADCEVRRKWIASMQRILEMWIAESPKYRQVETRVRFTGTAIKPHFDMFHGKPWSRGTSLTGFTRIRPAAIPETAGVNTRIYSNERELVVGIDVKKGGLPVVTHSTSDRNACSTGDFVELFFEADRASYRHFMLAADGTRNKAVVSDGSRDCKWESRVEKTQEGWRAIVVIPFSSLQFEPNVNPQLRFFERVSLGLPDRNAKCGAFGWQNGVPHTPSTWGTLFVSTSDASN